MTSPIFSNSKVYACYAVYNEEELIRSSLDTVMPYVDGAFALSGKFFDDRRSDDRTDEILREFGVNILPYKPNLTQIEARNYLYSQVPEGSWIFIVDGDEVVIGNMKDAMQLVRQTEKDVCSVLVFNNGSMWTLRPRFVRSRKDFHLGERHWDYCFADKKFFDGQFQIDHNWLKMISILNCNPLRTNPPRVEYHKNFRTFLTTKNFYENQLKQEVPA